MARQKDASPTAVGMFRRRQASVGQFVMMQPQLSRVRMTPSALRKISEGVDVPRTRPEFNWQGEAFDFVDLIGEVGYVVNLTANVAAACDLVVEHYDAKTRRWSSSDDDKAARVMQAFVGPRGDVAELKRRAIMHIGAVGESYLVGLPVREGVQGISYGLVWEFLSVEELRIDSVGKVTRRLDGTNATAEELAKDVYIARLWQSHPRFSGQADSALRRIASIAREVLVLTQLVDAIAKTRLNAGMFFVPDEISSGEPDDEAGDIGPESNQGDIDQLTRDIINHVSAPVEQRDSAASLVPLIMRGPAKIGDSPTKDLMGLIALAKDLDGWAKELREEALGRLAIGLDVPPEIIRGKGGLNHWTGYNVDGDFINKHVSPKGDLLADFLTHSYLRPMLEEGEELSSDDAALFRLRFDPSPVRGLLDQASNSRVVYDRGQASATLLRRAHGIPEADAPDDVERVERQIFDLIKAVPTLSPYLLPRVRGFEDVKFPGLDGADTDRDGLPDTGVPNIGRKKGRPPRTGPPVSNGDEPSGVSGQDEPTPNAASLVDRVATAADAAIDRAYERAGTKLVSAVVNKDPALKGRLAGADKVAALTLVASGDLERHNIAVDDLMDGAWDRLSQQVRRWVRTTLEDQGVTSFVADDRAALAASELCSALDSYARAHLHRGLVPGPNGLRVPDELVVRSLGVALPLTAGA